MYGRLVSDWSEPNNSSLPFKLLARTYLRVHGHPWQQVVVTNVSSISVLQTGVRQVVVTNASTSAIEIHQHRTIHRTWEENTWQVE